MKEFLKTKNFIIAACAAVFAVALLLVFPAAGQEEAFASSHTVDWGRFQNSEDNNGVTDVLTPESYDETCILWSKDLVTGYTSSFTPPLIIDGYIYTASQQKVYKISRGHRNSDGEWVDGGKIEAESEELENDVSYAMHPMTYSDEEEALYVPLLDGRVQCLDINDLSLKWTSKTYSGDQALSPIYYRDGFIYTGTWGGETTDGVFYCVNADKDTESGGGSTVWEFRPSEQKTETKARVLEEFVIPEGASEPDNFYTYTAVIKVKPQSGYKFDKDKTGRYWLYDSEGNKVSASDGSSEDFEQSAVNGYGSSLEYNGDGTATIRARFDYHDGAFTQRGKKGSGGKDQVSSIEIAGLAAPSAGTDLDTAVSISGYVSVQSILWKTGDIPHGFYWAGAYVNGRYVIVGSDDGQNNMFGGAGDASYTRTASVYCLDRETGEVIDRIDEVKGDVRSTIVHRNGYVYFTTKGGLLYKAKLGADGKFSHISSFDTGAMMTASPVVYNNRIYVGVCGMAGQFNADGGHKFCVFRDDDELTGTAEYETYNIGGKPVNVIKNVPSGSFLYCVDIAGYPQAAPVLSTAVNRLYFTYNAFPGGIYYLEDDGVSIPENPQAHRLFSPEGSMQQYSISPIAVDSEGTLYIKNDSGNLMAAGINKAWADGISVKIDGKEVTWNKEFRSGDLNYVLTASEVGYADVTVDVPDGMTAEVNGERYTGTMQVSVGEDASPIEVKVKRSEGGEKYARTYTLNISSVSNIADLAGIAINCNSNMPPAVIVDSSEYTSLMSSLYELRHTDSGDSYVKTNDRRIASGKTYYIKNGGDYEEAVLDSPAGKGWYEQEYAVSEDTKVDFTKTYYRRAHDQESGGYIYSPIEDGDFIGNEDPHGEEWYEHSGGYYASEDTEVMDKDYYQRIDHHANDPKASQKNLLGYDPVFDADCIQYVSRMSDQKTAFMNVWVAKAHPKSKVKVYPVEGVGNDASADISEDGTIPDKYGQGDKGRYPVYWIKGRQSAKIRIDVTSESGKVTKSYTLELVRDESSIDIGKEPLEVTPSTLKFFTTSGCRTAQAKAMLGDADVTEKVSWRSSRPEFVTVDSKGVISAVGGEVAEDNPVTVWARYKAQETPVSVCVVKPQAAAPMAGLKKGTYEEAKKITLTSATPDTEIYYTIGENGAPAALPTKESGIRYTGPVPLGREGSKTRYKIRAIAVRDGYKNSAVSELDYVIDLREAAGTVNIGGLTAPAEGEAFDDSVSCDGGMTVSGIKWYSVSGGEETEVSGDAAAGKWYRAKVSLHIEDESSMRFSGSTLVRAGEDEDALYAVAELISDEELTAVFDFPPQGQVSSVTLVGLERPEGGEAFGGQAFSASPGVTVSDIEWTNKDGGAVSGKAGYYSEYYADITIALSEGFALDDQAQAACVVDGEAVSAELTASGSSAVVRVPLRSTKFRLDTFEGSGLIASPAELTGLPNGISAGGIRNRLAEVKVTAVSDKGDAVDLEAGAVYWPDKTISASYDPMDMVPAPFGAVGQVTLPEYVDGNGSSREVTVTVSVDRGTIVDPVFTPASGTYTEGQTVTIACGTPGAYIKYGRSDIKNPDSSDGWYDYEGPFAVSGKKDRKITYTIKARAYAYGLESNIVTYKITVDRSQAAIAAAKKLKVSGFKVKAKGGRKFSLSWKKNKSAGGYRVMYKLKSAKKWKTLKTTTKTKLTSKKLKKGRKYQFCVCTYKDVDGVRYFGVWTKTKTVKCR